MVDNVDQQRELIAAAMRVYIPAMRRYITRCLDDALGLDWYETWLRASLKLRLPPPVHKQYRDRLTTTECGGRAPEDALDPDEFPYIIRDHSERFSNEINALRQEMRNISKDGTLPQERTAADAQRQAQRLLTNCDTVLRAVDEKAARRLPRLPDTDDSDSVRDNEDSVRDARREEASEAVPTRAIDGQHRDDHNARVQTRDTDEIADEDIEHNALPEVTIGTLPLSSDLRYVMTTILDQYREGMQRYVSSVLGKPSVFGPGWIQNVANVAGPDKPRMEQEIKKGTPAHEIIDVSNFPHIIGKFADHFPDNLRSEQYIRWMKAINQAGRRSWAHKSATRRRNVEKIAQACFTVLTETRFELAIDAAYEITQYFESDARSRLNDAGSGRVQAEEARSKVESAEREGDQAPLPGGSETDPERRQQGPDEPARLESAASVEQLGHGQQARADAGEARWIASSTQGGSSDGGGGPGAATLAGAGDEDRSPLGGGWQRQRVRRWLRQHPLRAALTLLAIAAIIIAVGVATRLDGSPPAVAPAIDGNISCEPISPMIGEAVNCTAALRGGEPASWSWSVDGNSTSQSWNSGDPPYGDQPTFETTFSSPGSYELTLTVANDADRVSKSRNIEVRSLPPTIDSEELKCLPATPTVGDRIRCTAPLGGGDPDSWTWSGGGEPDSQSWNRGDPPYGDQPTFETTFSSRGSYELTLTVANDGGRDSKSHNIEVRSLPPTIDSEELKCSTATPKVGEFLRCTAPLGGGDPDSWTWSGGGEPDSRSWNRDDPPYGDQPTFETTFNSPGSYELTLTVENDADRVSASHNIEVLPLAPTINSEELKCLPATPTVGDRIRCTAPLGGGDPDSWTWSGGGDPDSQSWNSGDPPYGDQPSFETTFSSPGSYELTLTVENTGGGNSAVVAVQVQGPPPPPPPPGPPVIGDISCEPASPVVGEAVSCSAELGGGEPDSWLWRLNGNPTSQSWGRGDSPYDGPPAFETTFSSPGSYELTLTVENDADRVSASHNFEVCAQQDDDEMDPPGSDDMMGSRGFECDGMAQKGSGGGSSEDDMMD